MNNIEQSLTSAIAKAVNDVYGMEPEAGLVMVEIPKDTANGDYSTNIAMRLPKLVHKAPQEIAKAIVEKLEQSLDNVETIEIAGPGFINFRMKKTAISSIINTVLEKGAKYGQNYSGKRESVLVEYVSANPTGPLHLGHARQGALGDVLANLLDSQGWKVSREFYYNDAGVQIGNLAMSVQVRCRQLQGESLELPENAYHGEYIVSIARDFLDKKPVIPHGGEPIESTGDYGDTDLIRRYSVAYLRNEQDDDLSALGVRFDNFFLESSLYTTGAVQKTVQAIIDAGYTYEADNALWLRTTAFEDLGNGLRDDKDRVMKKSDGTYTYFVPDVAYHLNKFSRGYTKAVNIQGTDHHGTIARVRAGLQAASKTLGVTIPKTFPEYILHKMLSVVKGGEVVKMSKRSGNYVTLRDLVDWAGRDAARFFLVSRKADAEFVFDVDLAKKNSDENPVYYLQYAHARICSVFANALEQGYEIPNREALATMDLSPLNSKAAEALIGAVAEYPNTLRLAARDHAPHILCYYLKDLAAAFHAFYNAERVLVDDAVERNARLALLAAARQVLANGLALLGISAPERMARRDDEADAQ